MSMSMNADQMTCVARFLEGLKALSFETDVYICTYGGAGVEVRDPESGDVRVDGFEIALIEGEYVTKEVR